MSNDMFPFPPTGRGALCPASKPSEVAPANAAKPVDLPTLPPPVSEALAALRAPRVIGARVPDSDLHRLSPSEREREMESRLLLAPPDLSGLSLDARTAAAERARALDATLATLISPAQLGKWLSVLNGGSSNPQGEAAFAVRVASYADLLADLPAAAFTAEARRAIAAKADGFFPSAAAIRAVIEPTVQAWRDEAALLRRIAQAAPPGTPQLAAPGEDQDPPLTDADLDRRFALWQAGPVVGIIAAQVRATRRHLQQTQPDLAARFASRFADLLHEKPAAAREPAPPAAPKDRPKVKPLPVGLEQRITASRARLASGTLRAGEAALEQMRLAAMEAALRRQQGAADPETA